MCFKVCCVLVIITAVQCSNINTLQNRRNILEQKQSKEFRNVSVLSSVLNTPASVEKEVNLTLNNETQSNMEDRAVQHSLALMNKSLSEEIQHTRKQISEVEAMAMENFNEIIDTVKDVKEEIGEIRSMQEILIKRFDMFLDSQTDNKGILGIIQNRINSISKVTEDISQTIDKKVDVQETTACKVPWQTHGRSSYLFGRNVLTWPEAVARCKELDAYLVQIDNSDENNFITHLAIATYEDVPGYGAWIGGNDEHSEGIWRWQHSEAKITFFNWGNYEPNGNKIENCLHLFKRTGMKWNDARCHYKMGYVCEKDI